MTLRVLAGAATLCALLWAGAPGRADDLQQWTELEVIHPLDESFELGAMLQTRVVDDISRLGTVVVRPFVTYNLSDEIGLTLGYDYFRRRLSNENSENRVWQQLGMAYAAGALSITNRLRFEQRIIDDVRGVTLRGRYRLRLSHRLDDPQWKLIASNEVFANFNQEPGGPRKGFSQNRLFGGVGYQVTPHLDLEAGYQWRVRPSASDHMLIIGLYFDTGGR